MESGGLARLTTNHIAERAGVSVGTIYQYFSDKSEILAALAHRRAEAVRREVAAAMVATPGPMSVRPIVRALMHTFEGSRTTRRVLLDALSYDDGGELLDRYYEDFLADMGKRGFEDLNLNPEAAFVLTHMVISLLRAAAADDRARLSPRAFEDELVLVVESYLAALSARSRLAVAG